MKNKRWQRWIAGMGRLVIVGSGLGLGALLAPVVPGCGRGLVDGDGRVSASATVGPQGGSLRLGQASLDAPPGALPAETEVTVQREPAVDGAPLGDVYRFSPDGLTFARPVPLTLPSPADPSAGLGVWIDTEWQAIQGSRYDARAQVVVGDITRLGRYGCLHLCASNADCSTARECRRGACQPHHDAGTGGSPGTGGAGTGGSPGTGGGGGAGGSPGTGGMGSGGNRGTGGTGGTGGGILGTGGMGTGGMGTGGVTGSGGAGGMGACPLTQPVPIDQVCPNPPQTCDYGATRCVCVAGRVWSCGPIAGGTGGTTGTGGATGTGGGTGTCADAGATGCNKPVGTACNAHAECASGYCAGAVATGTGCATDIVCTCSAKKPVGATCANNVECVTASCLTPALTLCAGAPECTCHGGAG